MENSYGIGVSNRYELFYCEDVDSADLIQQAEKKSKDKAEKKKDKDFTRPSKSVVGRGHDDLADKKKKDLGQDKRGKDKDADAHIVEERENRAAGDRGRRGRGFAGRGGPVPRENKEYSSGRPFQENQEDRGNRRGGRGEGGLRRGGGRYNNQGAPREGGFRKDEDYAPRYNNTARYENTDGNADYAEGSFGRGRGRGRGRGPFRGRGEGRGRGGRREFDRHSGTGYLGQEKKNGAGGHNWGDSTTEGQLMENAEFDEWNSEPKQHDSTEHDGELTQHDTSKEGEVGDEEAPKPDGDAIENGSAKDDDAAKVMTLDEWKAAQKETRVKPSFNLRKAGEGEDPKQWKNLFVLKKKEKFDSGDESEEEDEDDDDDLPANKKNAADLIQIVFSDPARRGGFGPRGGRGAGFEGRPGRRGGRGGPRGRPDRGSFRGVRGGFGDRNFDGGVHQRAPKVDDERDFPSLSLVIMLEIAPASMVACALTPPPDSTWVVDIYKNKEVLVAGVATLLCIAFVIYFFHYRRRRATPGVAGRWRFRKRDKMLFYGRKMLRKVKNFSGKMQKASRKRHNMLKLAREILLRRDPGTRTQLKVLEPPESYLEADMSNNLDDRLPPEVVYMLKSIRVFGHFERPLFLELCKHIETVNLSAGQYLFAVGDADESIYVVQEGLVNVFISSKEGEVISLKMVPPGDSIISLLSFADCLSGHCQPYKTVNARAVDNSTVLRLPVSAFQKVFEGSPESFVRVVQVIMVRLQRVVFTSLFSFLGLSQHILTSSGRRSGVPSSPSRSRRDPRNWRHLTEGNETEGSNSNARNNHVTSGSPVMGSFTFDGLRDRDLFETDEMRAQRSHYNSELAGSLEDSNVHSRRSTVGEIGHRRTRSRLTPQEEEEARARCADAFRGAMGLEDVSLVKDRISIREGYSGAHLLKQDSVRDVSLFYVISGTLTVSVGSPELEEREELLIHLHSGDMFGALAVLSGEPSFFNIRFKHFSRIGVLSKEDIYRVMMEHPRIVLSLAKLVLRRLNPVVRQIDFALDWLNIEAGKALYRQGDVSDCTYIILSGRLRSVIQQDNGKKELVAEYGRGDLVGVVELLTKTKRGTTVITVRDSEVAKLSDGLLNYLKYRFPMVVTKLIQLLGHRILGTWQKGGRVDRPRPIELRSSQANLNTVALLAVSDDVPLSAFAYELLHCLNAIGPSLRLTSEYVRSVHGPHIMEPANEFRLSSWCGQQEDLNRMVLYQCDPTLTMWTRRCIRQADCILIVALADKEPSEGKIERELDKMSIRTQKELVLLHRDPKNKPSNTAAWLNVRSWCSNHHHIRCPPRMFSRRSQTRIKELYKSVLLNEPDIYNDFGRLSRILTGTSVGIVLGGGGARGAAHVGMIRSILEAGLPIDMVGGVSIGAFMGALWCAETDLITYTQKAREFCRKMTQVWRQILDLTYPTTAMFSGRAFNGLISEALGQRSIEDLWIPYFTLTTDITTSNQRIHTHGSMWRYVRASMSLSGYMPPLCDPTDGHLLLDGGYVNNLPGCMWRYVRASMSIAGWLPPMTDPEDGHLLVDGAYINNVPADVMKNFGAGTIFAIDVGSQNDVEVVNYGDSLNGWWILWKRWNPFTASVKVLDLPDIQSRLAYVSCEVKSSDYCEYIRPPIDRYKTLQFGCFEEIKDVGYNHGKAYFHGLMKSGNVRDFLTRDRGATSTAIASSVGRVYVASKPSSFVDLARLVCQVKDPSIIMDENSDEDTASSASEEEGLREAGYMSEPASGPYVRADAGDNSPRHSGRRGGSLSETEIIRVAGGDDDYFEDDGDTSDTNAGEPNLISGAL
ncbi:unnamed protein product [Notodromas monacha]|uniref:lysophospholipase n=2 Tax=Pancrustacea TaxID=197562 RepID=A0A7R9BPB8_9CRUS|nr:unnamed protein product [Notodromas monacha]CAG0919167.1 unnamed protein product [Notodromas monacha]